jgi:hypothetical protein
MEHPDIAHCLKYGYPPRVDHIYCEVCDDCLDYEEVFEDSTHEYLCEECLLEIHRKQ